MREFDDLQNRINAKSDNLKDGVASDPEVVKMMESLKENLNRSAKWEA